MSATQRALTGLALALSASFASAASGAPLAQTWLTTADQKALLTPGTPLQFETAAPLPVHIEVDPTQRFQSMVGYGAAITEASAWLINHQLKPAQRDVLLNDLYGHGPDGIGLEFTRLTIGASDFSRTHYSLDDVPAGQKDMALKHFSLAPEKADVVPVVKAALAINPQLQVMASPWSAPAWMKTNGNAYKGHLKPEMYGVFSQYMLRYVQAMKAEGVNIFALTLQNEPHFEPDNYPGMRMDPPERAKVIGEHLGPLLKAKAPGVQIMEWDHNWDQPESPLAVLNDAKARAYVSSVAWHCYAGEPSVQTKVHEAYPDKDVWMTECSGGNWQEEWTKAWPWMMKNLVIGGPRNGARGVLLWNLALDENHNPHKGGCTDCRGVVTIDSKTGAVTRNMEYYALGHASRFVRQGARRIASTSDVGGLDTVAFQNPDNSVVLVVSNGGEVTRQFSVGYQGKELRYELPSLGVVTFTWPGAQ